MASWRNDYIKALKDRDEREKESCQRVDGELIKAYTALLDQVAYLRAKLAASSSSAKEPASAASAGDNGALGEDPADKQLRVDLAEALRSNGQLQNLLVKVDKELQQLRGQTKGDTKVIEGLRRQNAVLERKLGDRDEELRGKSRGFTNVQDEMISLDLQLNIAEQKAKKLSIENQELIDRWMARKGKEADAMNENLR